jgi:two-component system, chemotaxis family, response regulator Rcp1
MNPVVDARPVEILLVEDNPGDVRLTRETLRESKIRNNVYIAVDGVDALTYLRKQDAHRSAPTPDLILLDLNLPRKDGREVLAEIKGDPSLKHIPVVVLTTSDDERDVRAVYNLRANCYVVKPVGLAEFSKIVQSIEDFWFEVVRLPGLSR